LRMKGIKELLIKSSRREEFIDITGHIQRVLTGSGISDGVCYVFVPHTTCGVTINEHADPDVAFDLREALNRMAPLDGSYRHSEGNSPAHIKASLVGTSQALPVSEGRLCLGTWQGVFLCEFDGPRQRKVWVKIIEG